MAAFTSEKKLQICCRIENLDTAHSKFRVLEVLGSQIWSYQSSYDTSELWLFLKNCCLPIIRSVLPCRALMPEIVFIYSLLTNGFPEIMCLTWNSLVY